MGGIITRWLWGGNPDEVNSISGMTLRDVYAVQKTWAVVNADPGKHGMELFIRLFRADPETKLFFKAIRNLDEEQILKSYQFKAHAINLMSAINLAVTNLNQPEVVIAMMDKLGESHEKRKVSAKHFNETKDVFVGILQNNLHLTDDVMSSWDRFINFIYKHIFERLTN